MSTRAPTVGELVGIGAQRRPGQIAVMDRVGRSVSYAELDDRTDRLATALLTLGLRRRGDRVAAWMEDCVEYIELYLAVAKAGLVIVPVNARFRPAEVVHPIVDSGARALVWTAGLTERVADLEDLSTDLITLTTDQRGASAATRLEDLIEASPRRRLLPPDGDALYIIGYTSGTTGTPKGAMLTHRSVLAIARLNAISYRLPLGSTAALTGSMSFVATVPAHILCHLYLGGTSIVMGRWDVESLLATVASSRATFTYIPTPTIGDFTEAAQRDPAAWRSLRSLLHAGSRAEPDDLAALCDVVGGRFVEGWGMTEHSGGLATATTADDVAGPARRPGVLATVGRAVAECCVELVGPDGSEFPHDGVSLGELVVRSPALMDGYWGLPAETAEALPDGRYRSGDLGTIDPDGYVALTERRTDVISSGGISIYPSEIEACISAMTGVRECAVVGVPHERWGETVAAVVVPHPDAHVSADDVVAHCRDQLAGFKKPTSVVFADALPKGASLKVRRSAVREGLIGVPDAAWHPTTKRLYDMVSDHD